MSNVLFKPSAFRKYIVSHGLQNGQYDNIRDSYVRSEISPLRFFNRILGRRRRVYDVTSLYSNNK